MMKCNVCGCEFHALAEKRYTARDNTSIGLAIAFNRDEEKIYDAFDCPMCGCQVIAQERKRDYSYGEQAEPECDWEEAEEEDE